MYKIELRKPIPIEEGLKQYGSQEYLVCTDTSKANSNRRRIETQWHTNARQKIFLLRKPIPIEEGLKHSHLPVVLLFMRPSKANSNRRRIETGYMGQGRW